MKSKLKNILNDWVPGTVMFSTWLKGHYEITDQDLQGYKKRGWVKALSPGVFVRPKDKVEWLGALSSLQTQLHFNIHVGGISSLELHGLSQNLTLGKNRKIWIYGSPETFLPRWFRQGSWDVKIVYVQSRQFKDFSLGLSTHSFGRYDLILSSKERAMFELVSNIGSQAQLQHAYQHMEALVTLRPDLVLSLLKSCRILKTKRLFLYLAEKCNHAWLKEINLKGIRLGVGKQKIGEGGTYIPKYKMSVPSLEENDA